MQWTIERQVISDFRFELLKCIGELWSCLSSQCNGKECVAPLLFVFVYNLFFVFLWLLPLYFITEELSSCMPGLVVNCGIIDCCICFCFCFCIWLNFVLVFLWLLPLYFIVEELSPRMPGLVAPTVIGLIFTTRHLLYHSYTCGPLSSNSKSNNATLVLALFDSDVFQDYDLSFNFHLLPAHVDVQAVAPNYFFANFHAGTLFFFAYCFEGIFCKVPNHWFLENFPAR